MERTNVNPYPMPACSWDKLKSIIQAYHAARDAEGTTVGEIAEIAKTHRPVVSSNNNFLKELGILHRDKNKITSVGTHLATAIVMGNEALTAIVLQEIVRENKTLNRLVTSVMTSNSMSVEELKGQFLLLTGINERSKHVTYIKTVLDLLQESSVIQINGNTAYFNPLVEWDTLNTAPRRDGFFERPQFENTQRLLPSTSNTRTPLPLGPGRVAYIELPHDWKNKELSKLIKILELSLGEEEAS